MNTPKMQSFDEFEKKLGENALPLDDYPDHYLSKRKREADKERTFNSAFKVAMQALKDMRWQDITFVTNGEKQYPKLPSDVRDKIKEAYRANPSKGAASFKQGSNSFIGTFEGEDPTEHSFIYMKWERNGHRSHFPDSGIPSALRGVNLGYKLYRALLQKAKYLQSNTGGTTEKDRVWQSIVSPKKDAQGNLTEDDVHGIISHDAVFAMIKSLPDAEKIEHATAFLANVRKEGITSRNFAIDPELKAILPQDVIDSLDPAVSQRRQREAQQRRERELERQLAPRIRQFCPEGLDAEWNVGDYVVVKEYLLRADFHPLPVRKVISARNGTYTALKLEDLVEYERTGATRDTRQTNTKSDWVKAVLQPGQVDPTAGRVPRAGTGATATAATRNKPTAPAAPARTRTSSRQGTGTAVGEEQSPQIRRAVENFMRAGYDLYVRTSEWNERTAQNVFNIVPFLVRVEGVGRNRQVKVMNARTAAHEDGISYADFERRNMTKLNHAQLTSKAEVRTNDWVFVRRHKNFQGYLMKVAYITRADVRQPSVYLKVSATVRDLQIHVPSNLEKVVAEAKIFDYTNFRESVTDRINDVVMYIS